jgi:hypothetical protein
MISQVLRLKTDGQLPPAVLELAAGDGLHAVLLVVVVH